MKLFKVWTISRVMFKRCWDMFPITIGEFAGNSSALHSYQYVPNSVTLNVLESNGYFLQVVIVFAMIDVGPLEITLYDKSSYTYPLFAKVIGWVLALSSVLMVPFIAIKTLMSYQGSFSQVTDERLRDFVMKLLLFYRDFY